MKYLKRAFQWLDDLQFYCMVGMSPFGPMFWMEECEKHELKKIARGWGPGWGYWI